MNTNGARSIITHSMSVFYVSVVRSIGQVDEIEFDEIGQRAEFS